MAPVRVSGIGHPGRGACCGTVNRPTRPALLHFNRTGCRARARCYNLLAAPVPAAGFCQEKPDMKSRLTSMLPAVALALVSGAALAQFLYKSTMPDGKVIYGDAPTPGAVKVEKTRPDTSKKGISAATPKETEALRRDGIRAAPERRRVEPARGRDRGDAAQDGSRARKGQGAARGRAHRHGRRRRALHRQLLGTPEEGTKPAWNRCAKSSRGLAWNSAGSAAAAERET